MLSSLGFIYVERGNYCEAQRIFWHVNKFKPDLGNLGIGVVFGSQGNWEGALKAFEEALKTNPSLLKHGATRVPPWLTLADPKKHWNLAKKL